jgi:hypothetical protein
MNVIYRKTERGTQEVAARKAKLAPRVRTMPILVDGITPEEMLRREAQQVGAPEDFLEQLVALGLIESTEAIARAAAVSAAPGGGSEAQFQRFRDAQAFMNTTVVDALGIKSFFFTLKLERAATLADLRELAGPYLELMAKASGKEQAAVLGRRLKLMLG